MKILCKDCAHGAVCKHRFSYEQTLESLDAKVETPFTLSLECPYYTTQKNNNYILNDIYGTGISTSTSYLANAAADATLCSCAIDGE
jgi:hypothetical protein